MAHKVESMAYAGDVPWHGLGEKVEGKQSTKVWLEKAGLDWTLDKTPLIARDSEGNETPIDDKFAFVRSTDKKVMTIASGGWTPFQNVDVIGFMKDYVTAGGAELETAGSLRDGKIVWGLAKLKHSYEVTRGDKVNGYLLITASHFVGKANTTRLTTVRVVCANTMAMAESFGGPTYKQSHMSEFNVTAAKARIEAASEGLAECERRNKIIAKLKLTKEDAIKKVLVPVFDPDCLDIPELMTNIHEPENQPTKIAAIVNSMDNAPGAIEGTGWGCLNGVTHWTDHVSGHNAGSRMYRAWLGDYAKLKLETEEKLLELAS